MAQATKDRKSSDQGTPAQNSSYYNRIPLDQNAERLQDSKYNPAQEDWARTVEDQLGSLPTTDGSQEDDNIARAKSRLADQESQAVAGQRAQQSSANNKTSLDQREASPRGKEYEASAGTDSRRRGLSPVAKRWVTGGAASFVVSCVMLIAMGLSNALIGIKDLATKLWNGNSYSANSQRAPKLQKRVFAVPDENCKGIKCRLGSGKTGVSEKEIDKYTQKGLNPEVGEKDINGKKVKYIISFNTTGDDGKPLKVTAANFESAYKNNLSFRGQAWSISKPSAIVWRGTHALKKFNVFKVARNKLMKEAKEMRKYLFGRGTKEGQKIKPAGDEEDEKNPTAAKLAGMDDSILDEAQQASDDAAKDDFANPVKGLDLSNVDIGPEDGVKAAGNALAGGVSGATKGIFAGLDKSCTGYQLIRAAIIGAKIFKYSALIVYAMTFMTHADALRSGDLGPEFIAFIMGILVRPSTLQDSLGKTAANTNLYSLAVEGKVQNAHGLAYGNTGTPLLKGLLRAKQFFESLGANKTTCSIVKSWYGQLGLTLGGILTSVLTAGVGALAGAALGGVYGMIIAVISDFLTPLLVKIAAGLIAPDPEDPGGGYVAGEAVGAGLGATAAELGKGGTRPLTTEDVGVLQETKKEIAEMNKIEQMGKSPFSIDSPNSITSRFAMTMAPIFASPLAQTNLHGIASVVTSPMSLVGSSLNQLFTGKVSALSTSFGGEYCQDEEYRQMNLLTDAYCNPIYGEQETTLNAAKYEPNQVVDYMLNNGHVNEDGSAKSDDYQEFIESCVDGTTPLSPDGGSGDVTDDIDTRQCLSKGEKETMFRMYVLDNNILDGMDASAAGTLGIPKDYSGAPNTGSTLSPDACQGAVPAGDAVRPLCEALKYDNYGYLWGGGHGGTAEQFVSRFKAGVFTAGKSQILDCSGLVRIAIFEAYGIDVGGGSARMTMQSAQYFEKIPLDQAKPGDYITQNNYGHVAIVYQNYPDQKKMDIFHASTDKAEFSKQILQNSEEYGQIDFAYRYKGPKP